MSAELIFIIVGCAAALVVLLLLVLKINSSNSSNKPKQGPVDPYNVYAEEAVKEVFTPDFREELKNRGRLHFEKIINENAMFLQQDLQLTTSELNQYMKQQITNKLQEEFSKYEQSITDAKELAVQSINKTQAAIEEQRQLLSKEVVEQLAKDKKRLLETFEQNMAQIINHYILEALGNQIDLNDQLDFILDNLEQNKKAISEDVVDGA